MYTIICVCYISMIQKTEHCAFTTVEQYNTVISAICDFTAVTRKSICMYEQYAFTEQDWSCLTTNRVLV